MSEGPRIPFGVAKAAAAKLMELWGMAEPACRIVGSVRREKPDAGDLEFIAPMPSGIDTLFDRINACATDTAGLYAAPPTKERFAVPVSGLKRNFLTARLVCHMHRSDGSKWVIPVQVFRYTPLNRGWKEIMYTGPDEFGRLFLHCWKEAHGIGEGKQASIEGHLVGPDQKPISTPSEQRAFELCKLPFVDPVDRGRFAHQRNFT